MLEHAGIMAITLLFVLAGHLHRKHVHEHPDET